MCLKVRIKNYSPLNVLPRRARFMLWVILFGSFAAAVGYNAKQAGLVDNIYRPEALYLIDKIKPPW